VDQSTGCGSHWFYWVTPSSVMFVLNFSQYLLHVCLWFCSGFCLKNVVKQPFVCGEPFTYLCNWLMTCNDLFSSCLFTALLAVSVIYFILFSVFVVYVCICLCVWLKDGGGVGGRCYNSGSCLGQRHVGVCAGVVSTDCCSSSLCL